MPITESPIQGLVGPAKLLEIVFPSETERPSRRWLDLRCRDGSIPYIKLGRLIWFSPPEVIESLKKNHTLHGRKRR